MTLLEFLDQKAGSPPRVLTFPPRELRTMVGAIGTWVEAMIDSKINDLDSAVSILEFKIDRLELRLAEAENDNVRR